MSDSFSKLADALVPLDLAVRHIFKNVYGPVTGLDKLDGLAMAIAALATIFESEKESTKLPGAIPASVAFSGMFRGGGKELRFVDGRAPLLALCMKAEDVSYVIGVLRQGMRRDEQAENTFGAPARPTAASGPAG